MQLLVGLGNTGEKYAANRHNVGFMALDRIAADHGFSPWKSRFQGLLAEGRLGTARAALLKPQTFMNASGQSVGEAMRYLKLTPADVVVLHDELDLAPGVCRLKSGGGHAGHNGLRSIHQHIGDAYRRLRIGIGHPGHKDRVVGYVLSDFAAGEAAMVEDMLNAISKSADAIAAGDGAAFGTAMAAAAGPATRPKATAAPPARAATVPGAASRPAPAPAPAREPAQKPTRAPTEQPPSMADRLRALSDRFG